MTAVAAALFGAIMAGISGDSSGSDSLPRLIVGVLMGGLVVGWLEWQTLRLYKIAIGPLWCGLNAGLLVLIASIMGVFGSTNGDYALFFLIPFGLLLDVPRWGILRSRFPVAWWWIIFCGLGWAVDTAIFLFPGASTLALADSAIAFVALNGAINGIWMGLCRGGALAVMLRDRRARTAVIPPTLPAD